MHSCPNSLARKLSYSLFLIPYLLLLSSCSTTKQISKSAKILLNDTALITGHVGISFFEPASGKTWYSHNAEKYFIPASNTKLFTLYAGLKYIPDSLPAIRYAVVNDTTVIHPTGDPTFLHPDFKSQSGLDFMKSQQKLLLHLPPYKDYIGKGWAWDDYKEYYMAQRSSLPMYGNVITINKIGDNIFFTPDFFAQASKVELTSARGFSVEKSWDTNELTIVQGNRKVSSVPFRPDDRTIISLLADTLHRSLSTTASPFSRDKLKTVSSRHADSMYKIMIHRSDNFLAEQTLLMASNEKLGAMDDGAMISYILKNNFSDVKHLPKWVDGSGLSRYNLFRPDNFINLLNKLQQEFGIDRIKTILPTGGTGTLENYYIKDSSFIYAKTGTLSNNLALSGYIFTRKNKLLLFSIMVNNFPGGATPVRKAIEKFISGIIRKF